VSVRAFVAIGSNVGDRHRYCREAAARLATLPRSTLVRVSPVIETAPAEGVGGGPFLNAAAEIETDLAPGALLAELRAIEVALGREADHVRLGPRTIDLELLVFGELILDDAALTIPHPRMASRRFVLAPLAAIAPEARHPVLGCTVRELLDRLTE